MTGPAPSVTLCGQSVPCQHVCAFVSSTDEQYRILNPYFREGLEAGESLVTIVEADFHDEHLERMRAGGDADWVLRNLQTTDELMAYEAKVNLLAPQYDCSLLCVYNVNACSGQVVADALATHSHVVLGEQVRANPFYVEPLDFLKSVALRRTHPAPIRAA
ncbi:MEDS domain-containing protein [Cognatiluteimonas lumbrici]|uniref:MEDS domain-containing protein n=1 Tax=Cognatiluteimonas lumbrici TaxID=2559601 RepID=UPI00112AD111|nr:MEDS domain-containing protein [Luteimonas lumbrici]